MLVNKKHFRNEKLQKEISHIELHPYCKIKDRQWFAAEVSQSSPMMNREASTAYNVRAFANGREFIAGPARTNAEERLPAQIKNKNLNQ